MANKKDNSKVLGFLLLGGVAIGAYLLITRKGKIIIKATDPTDYPVHANITIVGQPALFDADIDADVTQSVKQGSYVVTISKAGFQDIIQNVTLSFPELTVTVNFDFQ